ncbi:NRAMP4A [Auxenochlorella protothecoides x Auxenochlorella symbiontica]
MGPGFLMCIAFIDPGNLEADLQTGARTGYILLWVVLASTCMGMLLQARACKLGVTTGKHLATHCRAQYSPLVRTVLWLMAELAIVGSDIQEVIGTALALSLLSRGHIPVWAGVILAALIAFALLVLEKAGVHWLERTFQGFVAVTMVAMGGLFFMADIPYAKVAEGLFIPRLPRSTIAIACGLLGAIIMPHNLFLHSALVHSRPLPNGKIVSRGDSIKYYNIEGAVALMATLIINICVICVFSAGVHGRPEEEDIGLANAGEFLGRRYGKSMEFLWGVGLLAAGQSSTMTGTYAGQFVMDGFLDLKLSATKRAMITRGVALCPTMLFAFASPGMMDALNQWINILQSVQLPFAVVPLLVLTSGTGVMPPEFASSALSTYSAWAVALVIICINSGTAVETFITVLPPGVLAAAGFALFAATYLAFILFLAVGPKRSARLLRIVGWGARDPRPAGGAGVGGKEPVPDSAVPLLAYQPERQ